MRRPWRPCVGIILAMTFSGRMVNQRMRFVDERFPDISVTCLSLPLACSLLDTGLQCSRRCPIIRSPQKSFFPGRPFTGKNPSRPAAARAGRIFTGKLSAGETFLGRVQSYNGETFYGADVSDILIRSRHIKSVIIFPRADILWRRHFNVIPALNGNVRAQLLIPTHRHMLALTSSLTDISLVWLSVTGSV